MAVVIESISTFQNATGNKHFIPKPSGLAVGDLMIAHLSDPNSTNFISEAGFTQLFVFAGGVRSSVFWKIATAGDVSASTFNFYGNNYGIGASAILRISGHAPTTPINTYSVSYSNGLSNPSFTGITPTISNCMLLFFSNKYPGSASGSSYSITTSNPASWIERYDFSGTDNIVGILMASALRPETTATGSATYSAGATSYNNGGLIAISPYIAAGPVNLKSYNTNLKANIKSINTNLIANVKSLDTNI